MSVVFVEDPNLAVDRRFWDAVPVVVKEDALFFSVASQGRTELKRGRENERDGKKR